jgi:hypothetical protein
MYLLNSKFSDLGTCWIATKIRVPKSEDLDSSAVPNHTLYQKITVLREKFSTLLGPPCHPVQEDI